MHAFKTPVDIANLALTEFVGSPPLTDFSDSTAEASNVKAVYDVLRQTELRRNEWVFARRSALLRPIGDDTLRVTPAVWSSTATYVFGDVIQDSSGDVWACTVQSSTGSTPNDPAGGDWESHAGPATAEPYDADIEYGRGELVYAGTGSDTVVYRSEAPSNADDPSEVQTYSSSTSYRAGQTVLYSGSYFRSIAGRNLGNTPVAGSYWQSIDAAAASNLTWSVFGGTVEEARVDWPVGVGPASDLGSKNAYVLPFGHLAPAEQADITSVFSGYATPAVAPLTDWALEGGYLVTRCSGPILYRFIADVVRVRSMDAMFCQGLAARIGMACCEPLTQSTSKQSIIAQKYTRFMVEARQRNAIFAGTRAIGGGELLIDARL